MQDQHWNISARPLTNWPSAKFPGTMAALDFIENCKKNLQQPPYKTLSAMTGSREIFVDTLNMKNFIHLTNPKYAAISQYYDCKEENNVSKSYKKHLYTSWNMKGGRGGMIKYGVSYPARCPQIPSSCCSHFCHSCFYITITFCHYRRLREIDVFVDMLNMKTL